MNLHNYGERLSHDMQTVYLISDPRDDADSWLRSRVQGYREAGFAVMEDPGRSRFRRPVEPDSFESKAAVLAASSM